MAAYMLILQANIAVLAGDPAAVVQLAGAARRAPGPVNPQFTALACQREARGLALLGETRDAQQRTHQAAAALDAARHLRQAASITQPVPPASAGQACPGRDRTRHVPGSGDHRGELPPSPFGPASTSAARHW